MSTVTVNRWSWLRGWVPFALLGWTAAAAGLWYLFPQLGPWPLFVALLPWLARLVATGYAGRRTPFDIPLLVFLLTAGASLWASYDPDGSRAVFNDLVGRRKLWGLMLSVLVFYSVAEFSTPQQRRWLLILLAGLGAGVSLWFMATNDWDLNPGLSGLASRVGRAIQTVLPQIPGDRANPNVAGGIIAVVLPSALELATTAGRGPRAESGVVDPERSLIRSLERAWGIVSTLAMGLGLLLSGSRGAFLAVGGALCFAAAWWLAGRLSGRARRPAIFAALLTGGSLVAVSAVAGVPFLRSAILGSPALANRLGVAYQAAHLVRDYLFTGCGLGNFAFVHSTYVLLIHVPEIVFAHSTPPDVAVEQGIFGAVALAAVWIAAAWSGMKRLIQSDPLPTGLIAGLLSLAVLVVHGIFDSTVYGSRTLLLFWVPVGIIVAAAGGRGGRALEVDHRAPSESWRPSLLRPPWAARAALGAALVVFAVLLTVLWRPLAAAWYANLGAVSQTLVELRSYDYHHFDNPTLDQVRQRENLSQAVSCFERALALDPGQVTARTRLAQIALARGEYETALEHGLAAWEAGYRDRVTRLVLGDALVAQGRVDEAAALVSGLERAESRLVGQASARYGRDGDWQRAAYAWRTVLALDPGNDQARRAAEQAEARASDE